MLASWITFDEYKLHQNGHVRDLNRVMVFDDDDSAYHVMIANVDTNTERGNSRRSIHVQIVVLY